eukprot:jgi/Antlo1/651/344
MPLNETYFSLNPMINISIEKRRECLKKIYNALNASPVACTYTPEKVKDIAITSEYECCENSKSESEYHSGIVQIIQRILSTGWETAGVTSKQRPTVIGNSQVFFGSSMGASNAFVTMPGTRMHKIPQSQINRQEINATGVYTSHALDSNAKACSIPGTLFSRYRYPHLQPGNHLVGQDDFISQHVPGIRGYQARDCTVPPLLRHHEAAPNVTQAFRKWDMHDRDINRLHNIRTSASMRNSVLHNFEGSKVKEKPNGAFRLHMPPSEDSIHTHRDVLQFSPFQCTAEGAKRSSSASTSVFRRNPKEDMLKTSYSYACGKTELQSTACSSTPVTKYTEEMFYRPQCANMLTKPAAGARNVSSIGSETSGFDLSEKLADVAIGESEKTVVRNKLAVFQKELLAVEEDMARHAKLGCSLDLNKKLETTCRIIHTQIEYILKDKYFLREVFVDVAIERIRKYAALIRSELDSAQKETEVYDFAKVCEKVKKAFRKMKDANPNFVFCIDPQHV